MPIGTPTLMKELNVNALGQATVAMALTSGAGANIGDLVVVTLIFGLASTPTSIALADDASGGSNVWQLDAQADKTTNQTPHAWIFSTIITHALTTANTITATPNVSINYPIMGAYDCTGIRSTAWKDQNNGGVGQSTSPLSGNITTTQANELLIGVCCTSTPQTLTYGSGWTRLGTHNSNTTRACDVGYSIKSAAGTYVYDGSIPSADWASSIASYVGTDQGGLAVAGPPPLLGHMGR